MLEFAPTFFAPEIREGFFLDATMKTVWAAELEVLAQIATVCERHGIQWYAAYGTLLGAIRHEGFIPWDDDIDIWVMRKDYNRLMTEYLPAELPEGYLVKSPLNELGYDQFHGCVLNGESISITPEHLRAFHGCPFQVAVDIFPLDHIAANTEQTKRRRELAKLAARAADLVFRLEEQPKGQSQAAVLEETARRTMQHLQETSGYAFTWTNFETKQWRKIGCDLLCCVHALAAETDEQSGDSVVEYWHYVLNGRSCPKEWFQEAYSADFEEFMLPVPCGYDELLHYLYGDYRTYVKNLGAHEYPLYAKQLRQLREAVRKKEEEIAAQGLPVKRAATDQIRPTDWRQKLADKKVVLYISGLHLYSEYGATALDKLESNLRLFAGNSDKILL